MLDLITALWFGIIGACIGSFLNVVAYRMPRRMSVVWKPSHCPQCGHDIRARDNLPVLGWLLLRGRCRDCAAPISPRYAVVEAIMGAVFVILAKFELLTGGANLPNQRLVENFPSGAWDVVWHPYWPLIGLFAFHAMLLCLLMAAALIALDEEVAPLSLIMFSAGVVIAALLRWRFDPALPFPAAGGRPAGVESAMGFVVGVFVALVASQVVPYKEIAERERRRRNLALALGSVGGFLGLGPVMTIAVTSAAFTGAFCVARRARHEVFRLLPTTIFAAALLYILFWNRLTAWGMP